MESLSMKILILFLFTTSLTFAATELAKVNSSVITLESFNSKYQENLKFFRYKIPTKKNVLEEMINRDVGVQEAKKLGLDRDPEVIERINTVLYHSLLDKKLASKFDSIQVSNEELENYYKVNPEIRTSHLFVQVRFDATAKQEKDAKEKILKIQAKLNEALRSGKESFSDIARAYSEGVAAPVGGDIDFQTKDKLDPAYYQAAVALKKPGNISNVVRSQFGYHIIKLTAVRDLKDVDRGLYKRLIFDEKRAKLFEDYMEDLRKKATINVRYDLIKE